MTIFTTLKVQQGIPLFFEKHHQRLREHAEALQIAYQTDIAKEIQKYLTSNQIITGALRISLSNKDGLLITERKLPTNGEEITTITIPDTRSSDKIYKTMNRQINEQATNEARNKNADDALFVLAGNIIESPIANIFSEDSEGNLITPPIASKGLNGITRQVIMENVQVIEKDLSQETIGPLVLVNSLRAQKVTRLNGKRLANSEKLFHKINKLMVQTEKRYLAKE